MDSCKRCEKRDAVGTLGHMGAVCKPCFTEVIEHRVRKHLRLKSPLKKGQHILLLVNLSKESVAAEHILEGITQPLPLKVEKRPVDEPLEGFDHVFYPYDANDVAQGFLKSVFSGNAHHEPESVVSCLLDSEIRLYADLKKLSYEEQAQDAFAKKMEVMEGYYPGSTFGLVKSKDQLK